MPLHLLGKKSWNVYNKENIARVRRDEALAKEREEENERHEQEEAAEKRIQILRGTRDATPPSQSRKSGEESPTKAVDGTKDHGDSRHRKRRRIAGEDDTDRDIRFAKEDAQLAGVQRDDAAVHRPQSDAPIVDDSGHISLFPAEQSKKRRGDNHPEAETEAARKKRELEDQYTMRFSNAAGFKQGMEQPWYSSSRQDSTDQADVTPSKDVWGNEDPRRREREKLRVSANDPLAAMKKGVSQLREVEKERKKWNDERNRELQDLKREQEGPRSRRRRRSSDILENSWLEDNTGTNEKRHRRHGSRRHHREDRNGPSKRSRADRDRHTRRSETVHARTHSPAPRDADTGWSQAPGGRYSAQFARS